MRRRARIGWRIAVSTAVLCIAGVWPAQAQTTVQERSLAEQLYAQRMKARAQEIVVGMGLETDTRGPVELPNPPSEAAERLFWWLPPSRTPQVVLDPVVVIPEPEPAPEPEPVRLTEIEWDRVGPREQAEFLERFGEALWSVEGMETFTPLDTIPTGEARARLFGHFGAPTRTAVARGVEGFEGSVYVQFEYWFVVNDSIPFVALDVDGPFARGLVLAGDYAHAPVLGQLKRDLTRRIFGYNRPMPFVDYYYSRDRDRWYRTGFDGTEYYTEEIDRPRWVRRRSQEGRWYLFR